MKVLFLDIDGVLNHANCDWKDQHLTLDPICVERVVGICDRTGARIVVSSTWRGSPDSMRVLRKAFGRRIIGVTPFGKLNGARRDEIGAWVIQHSAMQLECVAIDDDGDADGPAWTFVRTDAERGGLTEELAARVEAAFAGSPASSGGPE